MKPENTAILSFKAESIVFYLRYAFIRNYNTTTWQAPRDNKSSAV